MRRPLLLGTDNPHGSNPRAALLPIPRGGAGGRLLDLSGMGWREYRRRFERRNVCDLMVQDLEDRVVVVLGRETLRGLRRLDPGVPATMGWFDRYFKKTGCYFVLVPHPSGRNRFYNESRNRYRVRRLLRRLAAASTGQTT